MILLIILVLLFPTITFGQNINSTEQRGQRNIYNDAIKHYLFHITNVDKIKPDSLLIEKNEVITDSLRTNIKEIFLHVVDWTVINNKLDIEMSLILYKLFPLQFDKGQFSISIIPYSVTKKSNEVNLEYSRAIELFILLTAKQSSLNLLRLIVGESKRGC